MRHNPIIAIDGPDNVGKTSVINYLHNLFPCRVQEALDKHSSLYQHCISPILDGEVVEYDSYHLQLLMLAGYFEGMSKALNLANDSIVILDRSCASTEAYSIAEGLDSQWIKTVIEPIQKPDLTIILMGAHFSKTDSATEYYSSIYDWDMGFQDKLATIFLELSIANNWKVVYNIDGDTIKPISSIGNEIYHYIQQQEKYINVPH